jgi:hypothetical protein
MSTSIRSLRKRNKQRRRLTLGLRVPSYMAQWLADMTAAGRDIAVAFKKYIKAQP